MNQVTINLMHLTPTTIIALIEDLKEHSDTNYTAEAAIKKLTVHLVALVGDEEAKEMLKETN